MVNTERIREGIPECPRDVRRSTITRVSLDTYRNPGSNHGLVRTVGPRRATGPHSPEVRE
jgi:hypothetical protein